jgi:hypothetical protein
MGKKKNQYHQQAKKKHFLHGFTMPLETKGNVEHSALESGKDLLGLIVGGAVGVHVKPIISVLAGFAVTGYGHYSKNRLVQLLGVGLMAAPIVSTEEPSVKGLDGLDGVKERLLAYKDIWMKKFYLDKLMMKKAATTSGFGDVQFFDYSDPMNGMLAAPGDELAALDDIENQLAESAMEFQGHSVGQMPDYLLGEAEDRLY